jgi:hypothetical protein
MLWSVPALLKIAKTRSCSTSRRVCWTVSEGLYWSSRKRYSILRPLIPPRELT